MTRFLHTMLRVADPARSGAFYETLGMEFRRSSEIVRDGHHEASLFFYAFPGEDVELELTWNTDGRSYDLGTAYGHVAISVESMEGTLAHLAAQGIAPERPPYRIRAGGSLICFVQDPDGYRIELIEKTAT